MSTPVAIYKIVNTVNGSAYIGQSVNPTYRAKRHFWKNNGCVKLYRAIEKYGKEKFSFSVLLWCVDKADANDAEELLIALCDTRSSGYNITPGGFGTGAGKDNPFFGKTHGEDVKAKLAAGRFGRTMAKATREKIANANRNRTMSEATKNKLRARPKSELCSERVAAANKTRVWSVEAKAKLIAHNTGKKMSDETKAKIAAANKARVWTSESRAKLAASKTKKVML
jgi:group I intron endonuclease